MARCVQNRQRCERDNRSEESTGARAGADVGEGVEHAVLEVNCAQALADVQVQEEAVDDEDEVEEVEEVDDDEDVVMPAAAAAPNGKPSVRTRSMAVREHAQDKPYRKRMGVRDVTENLGSEGEKRKGASKDERNIGVERKGKKRMRGTSEDDLDDEDEDDEIIVVHEVRRRKVVSERSRAAEANETGCELEVVSMRRVSEVKFVSVTGPMYSCGICMEENVENLERLGACRHGYCADCIGMHVRNIALETKKYPIECPGCAAEGAGGGGGGGQPAADANVVNLIEDEDDEDDGVKAGHLDAWKCVGLLRRLDDSAAADALAALVVEKQFMGVKRYCSNAECATPFAFESALDRAHSRIQCVLCGTATCVLCNKAWHEGMCEPTEEEKKLLKDKRYQRCPSCAELVEKSMGCNFIRCRCGTGFCFRCGKAYKNNTPNWNNGHGTPGCSCGLA